MPILPSNDAVASRLGLREFHSVWNVQFVTTGNSPQASPDCGFQHIVRLSLPQDKSKSLSCWHQERERTPPSWPRKILLCQFRVKIYDTALPYLFRGV